MSRNRFGLNRFIDIYVFHLLATHYLASPLTAIDLYPLRIYHYVFGPHAQDTSVISNLSHPQTDQGQSKTSDRITDYLSPLLILTSIFFINFIARIISAPMMPTIEADLDISHTQAGSFFLLISTGYFVALLGSAFVSSRLTHRQTIILSCAALGLTLLGTAASQGLWGIRLALLALGMAAGLYLPSAIASLTTSIPAKHWGKAIAVHELAPNLSFVAAPLVCEIFLAWSSWRTAYSFLGLVALLLSWVFFKFGRGGSFSGEEPGFFAFKKMLSKPEFWGLVSLFCLGISGTLGLYTMLPLYMVNEHGVERQWANTLLSASRLLGTGMSFVGGWLSDRFGPKRVLVVVFTFAGLATIFMGLASTNGLIIAVFLQPLAAVCFFPAGLAALSSVSLEKERNLRVSLTVPIAFLVGGGLVPTLIGFVGDVHTFGAGIILVGGLILSGALITSLLHLEQID